MAFFSDFRYGFRSSRSTADLRKVIIKLTKFYYDKIARAFSRSGATWVVTLNISKAFDGFWSTGLLLKVKSMNFQVGVLVLFRDFSITAGLEKFLLEYSVCDGVPQDFILGPTLFLLYISGLMMLSVTFQFMLVEHLSLLSVIRFLICGNN